jgi:hypothetical protein
MRIASETLRAVKFTHLAFAMLCCLTAACSGGSTDATDAGVDPPSDGDVVVPPDARVCIAPEVDCGNECIDPQNDREFCGATTCEDPASSGEECADGFTCTAGSCTALLCEELPIGGGDECNPVTQAGCAGGEKCAQLVESNDPFLARTACVPEGGLLVGEDCTRCDGGQGGYDDCSAGSHCLGGTCSEICDQGPPDSCRSASEGPFDGTYCTPFADLFSDQVGLCVSACNPVGDTTSSGVITNNDCSADEGCYLNSTLGTAACSSVPGPAQDVTQNDDCYGPGGGGCFLNGCASGFTALLNNAPLDADGTVCARLCTAVNTHSNAQAGAAGADGKCGSSALADVGGTNGISAEHQCRFVQNFYSNTDLVPEEIGMCVPIVAAGGGSWADCKAFDWDGLLAVYNGAANAQAQEEAFNQFCLVTPNDPANSDIKPECEGLFRGCISLAEESLLVDL